MAQLPHRTIEMLPSVYSCRGFFLWVEISLPVSLVLSQFGVRFLPAAEVKRQRSAGYPASPGLSLIALRSHSSLVTLHAGCACGCCLTPAPHPSVDHCRAAPGFRRVTRAFTWKQGSLRFADALLRRRGENELKLAGNKRNG